MPKPKYYWDAGPFIAHLMDEQRPDPADLGGAREVLAVVDAGEAYLLTSSLTTVEVLNREGDGTVRDRFERLFARAHYRRIDTSLPIHQRAAESPGADWVEDTRRDPCSDRTRLGSGRVPHL